MLIVTPLFWVSWRAPYGEPRITAKV